MEKPSCETCPKKADHSCKFGIADMTVEFTKVTGCFDHPQAREYLMADVLKELECRIASRQNISDDGYSCRAEGMKEAIDIIKNGVEK